MTESKHDTYHIDMAVQEAKRQEYNQEKLNSEWCIICDTAATEDHKYRFMQAGGVLAGPFCSEECHWRFLTEDKE